MKTPQRCLAVVFAMLAIAVLGHAQGQGLPNGPILWASQFPGQSANEKIDNALAKAIATPGNNVIGLGPHGPGPKGQWLLQRAVRLPSHTTLVLAGAYVKVADGRSFSMVENDNPDGGNTDIHIIGWGEAKLDGNARREPTRAGGAIHFYNVDQLTLSGFQIGATAGWAFKLENVRNVHASDLRFFQGNEHPWQDGIHVVGPAHTVVINNITGTFGDDVIVVDSAMGFKGKGGAVTGVTVTNVVATNVWGAAILRTIAAKGKPVDGVYCNNLTFMAQGAGGTDAAIKIGWDGMLDTYEDWRQPSAEEHKNIVVENLNIPFWKGPVVTVQNDVKNLVLRNVSAKHEGPFFYNLEHNVDGLTIDNCHSTLVGNPPETLIKPFFEALVANKVYPLSKPYQGTFLTDRPGAIAFDHAHIQDATITNTTLDFQGTTADPGHPVALRVYGSAKVSGLFVQNVRIKNYKVGIKIDEGAQINDFTPLHIRYSNVANKGSAP